MFGFVRNKTSIFILVFLMLPVSLLGALTFGNYIPLDPNVEAQSAGSIIVTSLTQGNYNLTPGESKMHYLDTFVGDRSLRYSASAGVADTKLYNAEMITAVITRNAIAKSLECTFSILHNGYVFSASSNNQAIDMGLGTVPYLCILVKVKGTGQTTSTTPANWYNGTYYEVIGIIDSENKHDVTFTLDDPGDCVHVIQVPFSNLNTTFLSGATASNTSGEDYYYTRYHMEFNYSYTYNNKTVSGSSDDNMTMKALIHGNTEETYSSSTIGFIPAVSSLSISELLENNSGTPINAATTLSMVYSKLYSSAHTQSSTLYVKLTPYPDSLDNYYFIRKGDSSLVSNRYFLGYLKLGNFTSEYSDSIILTADGSTSQLASSSYVDSRDYTSPILKFTVTTKNPNTTSATEDNVNYSKRLQNTNLSFDIFPYILTTPSVMSGGYSMYIRAELSVQ